MNPHTPDQRAEIRKRHEACVGLGTLIATTAQAETLLHTNIPALLASDEAREAEVEALTKDRDEWNARLAKVREELENGDHPEGCRSEIDKCRHCGEEFDSHPNDAPGGDLCEEFELQFCDCWIKDALAVLDAQPVPVIPNEKFCEQTNGGRNPHPEGTNRHRALELGRAALALCDTPQAQTMWRCECGRLSMTLTNGPCPSCGSGNALERVGTPQAPVKARDERQKQVSDWCAAAFGADHAASIPQRGIRHAEEAIETAQASGCDPAMIHKLVDYIYEKPAGALSQEIGGSGLTLLALAQAAGLSADDEERLEVERVLAKPLSHFAARNKVKNDAGFNVAWQAPSPTTEQEEK